ncbi:hypothetical protein D9758_018858 [Tetrapyrgos nigripes]|uniref:Reverse transcriptase Ty1/copia-type domain-containing protein n=1 Tax=Tetrapyrgos nigripes TaxID=182062 RepID=A0A8H5EZD4_9AGAR|nr:hypothetical protein D9758_018858 [Tetrapyrgos nigripes]
MRIKRRKLMREMKHGQEMTRKTTGNYCQSYDEDSPVTLRTQLETILEPDNTWVLHSYNEMMKCADLWMKPMEKKLAKLDSQKAFTPVLKPKMRKIITTQWVYTLGYDQVKGIHYDDTWAIVARYESERFMIAIATCEGLDLWSGDFTGAYLNVRPQGVNYLTLPEGFQERYSLCNGKKDCTPDEH